MCCFWWLLINRTYYSCRAGIFSSTHQVEIAVGIQALAISSRHSLVISWRNRNKELCLCKYSSPEIVSHFIPRVSVEYKFAFHQIECLVRLYWGFIGFSFFLYRPLLLLVQPITHCPFSFSLYLFLFKYKHLQAFLKCTFPQTTRGWCVHLHDKRWWLSMPSRPF